MVEFFKRTLCLLGLSLLPGTVSADPYVGVFVGELEGRHYQVSIEAFSAGVYDGILLVDDKPMQLDARRYGDLLTGLLRSEDEKFGFRARLQGSILILETEDGRRVVLHGDSAQ